MGKLLIILLLLCMLMPGCYKEDELAERVKPAEEIVDQENETAAEKEKNEPASTEKEIEPISGEKPGSIPGPSEDPPDKTEDKRVGKPDPSAGSAIAESERTEAELWEGYNEAKKHLSEAREQEDHEASVEYLLKAADFAERLGRNDIAVWQYNNIGYYSILEFKRLVNYQDRMDTLQVMKPGAEKTAYLKETRELFNQHMEILSEGLTYLRKAESMEEKLNNAQRMEKILSNIRFIRWVEKFAGEAS